MPKPQNEYLRLTAKFVQMASRYLAGGVDDPKFKPIVRWALQSIPFLNEQIVETSAFNNWDAGQNDGNLHLAKVLCNNPAIVRARHHRGFYAIQQNNSV